VRRGQLEGLGVERRQVDRDVGARRGEAQLEAAVQLEELAVVLQRLVAHQGIEDFDHLTHPRQGGLELDAVKMLDDLDAAGAESGDHAATGDLVESGEVLRQGGRGARVDIDDAGGQADALGAIGGQRQQGEAVASPGLGDP
jgi:hypothetical protein